MVRQQHPQEQPSHLEAHPDLDGREDEESQDVPPPPTNAPAVSAEGVALRLRIVEALVEDTDKPEDHEKASCQKTFVDSGVKTSPRKRSKKSPTQIKDQSHDDCCPAEMPMAMKMAAIDLAAKTKAMPAKGTEDLLDDLMRMGAVEPPQLRITKTITSEHFPGAFAIYPTDYHEDPFNSVDNDESRRSNQETPTAAAPAIAAPLSAELVGEWEESEEEDDDEEQQQLDEEEFPKIFVKAQPMNKNFIAIGFFRSNAGRVISLLAILVFVGLVAATAWGIKNANPPAPSAVVSTASPSSPSSPQTIVEQTEPPVITFQIDMLPSFTQQAILANPDSPQAQAWQWLQDDPFLVTNQPHRTLNRFVLATFYYSTSGEHWQSNSGWLNHTIHECDWYSDHDVFEAQYGHEPICNHNDEFISLNLRLNHVAGTLPPEFAVLAHSLEHIELNENDLEGLIPSEIGLLTKLTYMNLLENAIVGTFPSELFQPPLLNTLILEKNIISGSLPTLVGNLSHLTKLVLTRNKFTGAIPSEIGLLQLTSLYLDGNRFEGTLPRELFNRELVWFAVDDNLLSGSIPTQVGLSTDLRLFQVSMNGLTGDIPTEVALLTKLERLYLSDNSFAPSEFPTELGSLTILQQLLAGHCQFTGTVPSLVWEFPYLTILNLEGNQFSGQLPSPTSATKIQDLQLAANRLSGTVPSELGGIVGLRNLDLSENTSLAGRIPSELGMLPRVAFLKLNDNSLEGGIPDELFDLLNLQNLDLSGNVGLTGEVPMEFCNAYRSSDILLLDCDGGISCSCCTCL